MHLSFDRELAKQNLKRNSKSAGGATATQTLKQNPAVQKGPKSHAV